MARGAQDRGTCSLVLRRALLAPAVLLLLVSTPAVAGAGEGSSEWPSPGGSAQWPAEPIDAAPPSVAPPPATEPAPEPEAADPTAEEPPVAADPPAASPATLVAGVTFPVVGPSNYSAGFGAPRSGGRSHEGIDIFADKMTPVVAAAAGTVSFVRDEVGGDCCVARIRHDDGRSSLYLHLNNDTPGTDDGRGYGLADGIEVGVRVEAGTVIGFVGDSGNAEDTPSHLHFELHDPAGIALDPFPFLQVAQGAEPALFASVRAGQPETLPRTGVPIVRMVAASVALLAGGALLAGRRRRATDGRPLPT